MKDKDISVIGLEKPFYLFIFFKLRNIGSFWDPRRCRYSKSRDTFLLIVQALGIIVISSSTAEM